MLLHSVISAGTYLAAKQALGELSPFAVALFRFGLAGAFYASVLALRLRRPHPPIARRDLLAMAGLGVVAVPLNQGFFLAGLSLSTSGHAALMYALTPIFVFLLARWRLGERTSRLKVAGILTAFAGVVVVLLGRGLLTAGADAWRGLLGDLMLLVAVVAWAAFAVGGKVYAERYGVLTMTSVAITFGTLAYLPLGLALTDFGSYARLSTAAWGSLAYLVAFTSIAAYLIYYWAMQRSDASRVAVWSNTQPVFTALLAWALHDEPITGAFVAGGAMVVAGVVLTDYRPRR